MKKLLLVKPLSVNEVQKINLEKAGYSVIEVNSPQDIKVVDDFTDIDRDTLLRCALEAIGYGASDIARTVFEKKIREAILSKKER